jgi:hypothetical protein
LITPSETLGSPLKLATNIIKPTNANPDSKMLNIEAKALLCYNSNDKCIINTILKNKQVQT